MNDKQTTRRRFLVAALTFSGVAGASLTTSWLRIAAAQDPSTDASMQLETLSRLARTLFPHDGLSDAVYGAIISDVVDAAATDPNMAGLLDAAEHAIDSAAKDRWLELDTEHQHAVLRELEGQPFFAGIRETVRFRLYYHPQLWAHINYPGSSKEHGGYLYRGFDDIAWLPADE